MPYMPLVLGGCSFQSCFRRITCRLISGFYEFISDRSSQDQTKWDLCILFNQVLIKTHRHNDLAKAYLGQLHEAGPGCGDEPERFQRTIHELREDVAGGLCRLSAAVHLSSTERKWKPSDTLTQKQHYTLLFITLNCSALKLGSYLEAHILQVVGVPFDYLLDEVWVCGLQVGAGWLIQFELKASPQLWHVKSLVPAPAHLWWHQLIKIWF